MATNNGIATAAGVPFFDGVHFPEWLSEQVNLEYREKSVIPGITCTDHTAKLSEGGNKVTITGLPKFTSKEYTKGGDTSIDHYSPSSIELLIDKARFWGFPVYDIDKRQATLPSIWEKWAKAAALDQNEVIESLFLADIVDDVAAENMGATAGAKTESFNLGTFESPLVLTKDNVIDIFALMGGVLGEQKVPEGGWFALLPPWVKQRYLISDSGKTYITGDAKSTMRNGMFAPFDNFDLRRCNALPQATNSGGKKVTTVLFGKQDATIFFTQFEKALKTRSTKDRFCEEWSGLQVYGYKVQRPEALGVMYVTPA